MAGARARPRSFSVPPMSAVLPIHGIHTDLALSTSSADQVTLAAASTKNSHSDSGPTAPSAGPSTRAAPSTHHTSCRARLETKKKKKVEERGTGSKLIKTRRWPCQEKSSVKKQGKRQRRMRNATAKEGETRWAVCSCCDTHIWLWSLWLFFHAAAREVYTKV